ncbi:MAG: HAD family phosphatase [Simkaniaceae bacterium]
MKTPQKISVFDLDHTLINGNCSSLFFLYLIKRKILPRRVLCYYPLYKLKFHIFGWSLQKLHERVFRKLLKGRSFIDVKQALCDFLLIKLPDIWNHSVIAYLKRAQHLGHYTVILSNSPSFLVEPIAKLLNVDECQATEYIVDELGFFQRISKILDGPQKAYFIKKIATKFSLGRGDLTAYSDSYHDIAMLEAVDHPVAVNPDSKLLHFSQKKQWKVLFHA